MTDPLANVERLLASMRFSSEASKDGSNRDLMQAREAVRLLLDVARANAAGHSDSGTSLGRPEQRNATDAILAFARSLDGDPR